MMLHGLACGIFNTTCIHTRGKAYPIEWDDLSLQTIPILPQEKMAI
jgi:hypothetical protein